MLTAPQLSDALALVATKDHDAFQRVYTATSAKLFGIALRILTRRDLAEEVLQEVYVTIWERAGDFDPSRASAITWMAAITRNRALDVVRRSRTMPLDEADVAQIAGDEPGPFDHVASREALRRLLDCMDGLGPQRRELVLLAYHHGLSRKELATRCGQTVATVKTWLHRSLKQLKDCLGE